MTPSRKKSSTKKSSTKKASPKKRVPAKKRAPARTRAKSATPFPADPTLDLVLERTIPVPVAKVWAAWTQPKLLKKWFAPRPWKTVEVEPDLRPGGIFRSVMESPEGERIHGAGCFLEVVPNRRLVWTDALLPGYRPAEAPFFTAVVTMEPVGRGETRYRAVAIHKDEATRKRHEEMGFHEGWGKALDQLVEVARKR